MRWRREAVRWLASYERVVVDARGQLLDERPVAERRRASFYGCVPCRGGSRTRQLCERGGVSPAARDEPESARVALSCVSTSDSLARQCAGGGLVGAWRSLP